MALRLHQNPVDCPTCGFYIWTVFIVVSGEGGKDKLDSTICPSCDPEKWLECIQNAVLFEPLERPEKKVGRTKGFGNIIEKPHSG